MSSFLNEIGCTFDIATDGAKAFEKIKSHNYHLILLDIGLPKLDGITVAKMVRNELNNSKLPIIALTAYSFLEEEQKNYIKVFSDILYKPFSFEELIKVIKTGLDPHPLSKP